MQFRDFINAPELRIKLLSASETYRGALWNFPECLKSILQALQYIFHVLQYISQALQYLSQGLQHTLQALGRNFGCAFENFTRDKQCSARLEERDRSKKGETCEASPDVSELDGEVGTEVAWCSQLCVTSAHAVERESGVARVGEVAPPNLQADVAG